MAKQRQIRIEQRGAAEAMARLETASDEELEAETKFKSAAQAILGARAAERYDAKTARAHFQKALAAARPQERMQLRRMAEASLALAERRPDDLKQAVERLGQAPPSNRQLMMLRLMGLIAPPPGSGLLLRVRSGLTVVLLVAALLAIGLGLVELLSLPFGGGVGVGEGLFLGLVVVLAALGVMAFFGRRRQQAQLAARRGGD